MKLQTVTRPLRWDETASLCAAVGWSPVDRSAVETGLGDDLFTICALEGERAVGCGRVVDDGGINFYIQHVIVMPSHQGRGIGGRIMDAIMVWLDGHAREGSFVGLRAAEGVTGFYEPYGFARRTGGSSGHVPGLVNRVQTGWSWCSQRAVQVHPRMAKIGLYRDAGRCV